MMPSFPISKFRFTLEAIDTITLPACKGSAFHGGFGHALKQISPTWFKYFYQPKGEQGGDIPKPYVILPPLDSQERYTKGQQFHLEITLIGEATKHYAIVQAAIEYLGNVMGLGYDRGKYKVISIDTAQITNDMDQQKPIIASAEIIKSRVEMLPTKQLKILFPTRLRLKKDNKLCRKAPTFQIIMERLIGRLTTLQAAYSDTAQLTTEEYQQQKQLIEQAKQIKTQQTSLRWDDWNRFSGRSKEWMKFGGLVGEINYQGELEPFLPYLALGEWLHIGGKTSFGLGKFIITNNSGKI